MWFGLFPYSVTFRPRYRHYYNVLWHHSVVPLCWRLTCSWAVCRSGEVSVWICMVSTTKAIKLSIFLTLVVFYSDALCYISISRRLFGKFRLKRKPRGLENNPEKEEFKKNQSVVGDWTDFYLEKIRPTISCNKWMVWAEFGGFRHVFEW